MSMLSTGVGHFGPKFSGVPGVPLGVEPLMFGSAESEHPRLTNREIISEEFQPIDHNPPTLQTDRQTNDMHRKTAFCTKVHRALKTFPFPFKDDRQRFCTFWDK